MWFGSKESELERQLIETYTNMKLSLLDISKSEAEKMTRDMLKTAKQKMKESGQDKLPSDFGSLVLQKEKENPAFMKMNIKRQEGVRDEDILWFWNMYPLERCVLEVDDENTRLATFTNHIEKGMSSEDAVKELRKFHPMLGNPEDTEYTKGDDRPLPPELKDRINKWLEKHMDNPEAFKNKLQQFKTMNAFIRSEIRQGNL